jgi:hypothetical protein
MSDFKAEIVKAGKGDPIQVRVYDLEEEPANLPLALSFEFPDDPPLDQVTLHQNNGEYHGELNDAEDFASFVQVRVRFPGTPVKVRDYPKEGWKTNLEPDQYQPDRAQ